MLTYQLVQPAFAFLKLSSLFGAVRLQVSVSSGELQPGNHRGGIRIHRLILLLKIIQLTVSLTRLTNSLDESSKCIENAVVVAIVACIVVVALVWSLELDKTICDVIIMLSPLRNTDASDSSGCRKNLRQKTTFWRKINRLIFSFYNVVSYIRVIYRDLGRLLPTFSVYDMLTIIVPMAINSFAPVFYFCTIIGQPKDIFMVSLLNPAWEQFEALRIAAILFDLTVTSFVAMTLELGFFTLCAAFAMYTRDLKDLEGRSSSCQKSFISRRSMKGIWKEIRRMTIVVNIGNHVGSICFYSGKIMTFMCSVLGTFYILCFGFTDFLSYGIALLAVQAIMFYVLCLGNAYVITETMDGALQNIKLMSQFYDRNYRRELKQRIRSVRPLAIMEAGFREMSNDTTPEFADFYVNQVIALVLTFYCGV